MVPNPRTVPTQSRPASSEAQCSSTPTPVGLDVHGADSRQARTVVGEKQGSGMRYAIPVDPGMGDSPYAAQSLWEFRFRMDTPQEQGAWKGTFHVSAKAVR